MTARYEVCVDAAISDPTDPDLFSESVLEGCYADVNAALAAAKTVSRKERTIATVYDTARNSTLTGTHLLVAGYDNGRSI